MRFNYLIETVLQRCKSTTASNLSKLSQLAYTSHAVSSHYAIVDLEMLTTVNEVCQPSSLGLLSLSHLFTLWKTFTALTFWDMMDAAWHWISWYDGPSNLHFFGKWSAIHTFLRPIFDTSLCKKGGQCLSIWVYTYSGLFLASLGQITIWYVP